jgi:hypothetical protein
MVVYIVHIPGEIASVFDSYEKASAYVDKYKQYNPKISPWLVR